MLEADGSFTYTPGANFSGTDTFTYAAEDGYAEPSVATVTITVDPVNDAPVAHDAGYTTSENTTLVVNAADGVLANDTDPTATRSPPRWSTTPQHGSLTLEDDGSFTYTPGVNFTGTDTFTYRASDGELLSDVVTVTIDVGEGNDTPAAVEDSYSVAVNGDLNVLAADGVLANDTDPDGDTLVAVLIAGASHGDLTLKSTGAILYTPGADYHGTDTFSYAASDGVLSSETVVVRIDVNTPADAADDAYDVDENVALVIDAAAGVLANDTDTDGDALAPSVVTGPEHGTLELNADGSFTYTPEADFTGTDTFTYAAEDGFANPTEATVTLNVNAVDAVLGSETDWLG